MEKVDGMTPPDLVIMVHKPAIYNEQCNSHTSLHLGTCFLANIQKFKNSEHHGG
jgi:hypothetical protein